MPVHVKDPLLGPGAMKEAQRLFMEAPEDPDVVIVIYAKNVSLVEGRTGVGTAVQEGASDQTVAFVLRQALRSLERGN